MTTMSEAEIQEAMGDYTIMHEKYDALRSFIKDKTGMDLQTIASWISASDIVVIR